MADRLLLHMQTSNSADRIATDTTMNEGEENGKSATITCITEARSVFDRIIKDVELLSRELYRWKGTNLENDEVAKSIFRFADSLRACSLTIRQSGLESLPLLQENDQRWLAHPLYSVETAIGQVMQESGKATPAIQPQHGINFTSLLLERAAEHLTMSMEIMECLSANWGVERPQAPAMHNLARNKAEVSTSI
jgi:hypothetical protein